MTLATTPNIFKHRAVFMQEKAVQYCPPDIQRLSMAKSLCKKGL